MVRLPSFLLLYCFLWKEVTPQSPQCFFSLRVEQPHKPLGILSQESCLFSLIYLIIHLFISVWPRGCFFYTLGYNLMQLCFVAQTAPAVAAGSSFSWLLCPFDMHLLMWFLFVCFWGLPYFLALPDAPSSFCVFPAPEGLLFILVSHSETVLCAGLSQWINIWWEMGARCLALGERS